MKYVVVLCIILYTFSCSKQTKQAELVGDYFGQSVDTTLSIFAPGIISKGYQELNAAFSPDGNTFMWTIASPDRNYYVIMQYVRINNIWQGPEVASFSGRFSDADPFFSPDGQRVYFISKRPLSGDEQKKDFDIWYVAKIDQGWSEAVNVGAPINTDQNEFYVSVTSDGAIVYSGTYEDGLGGGDIYMATPNGDTFDVQNLGEAVNSKWGEGDPYISPDGNMLIFASWWRDGGYGSGDIYISFKKEGEWSKAKNLGPPYSTGAFEYCPIVSPDGQYFFLTSYRSRDMVSKEAKTYDSFVEEILQNGNGLGDVYWVKSSVLENYRD